MMNEVSAEDKRKDSPAETMLDTALVMSRRSMQKERYVRCQSSVELIAVLYWCTNGVS